MIEWDWGLIFDGLFTVAAFVAVVVVFSYVLEVL
jgi:hypothetical protein